MRTWRRSRRVTARRARGLWETESRASEETASIDENPPLRQRVARLSRLTVALIGLTAGLVGGGPLGRVPGGADGYRRPASSRGQRQRSVGLADPGRRRGSGSVLRRTRRSPRGGGDACPGAGPADSAASLTGDAQAADRAVDAARPVRSSAGRGAGVATEQAARERGWCAHVVAADGAGAGARRGAHDRGDVGVAVATDQATRTGWWSSPTTAATTPPTSHGHTAPTSSPPSATPRRRPGR